MGFSAFPAPVAWASGLLKQAEVAFGGEGGIRTHGTLASTQHFQCCLFGRSSTSPVACCCDIINTIATFGL